MSTASSSRVRPRQARREYVRWHVEAFRARRLRSNDSQDTQKDERDDSCRDDQGSIPFGRNADFVVHS
jgi:hypothetical protein